MKGKIDMSEEQDIEVLGLAGVDSGELLIIDPAYIENDELVERYLREGLAVKVQIRHGDGLYPVVDFHDGTFLIDTEVDLYEESSG